MGEEGEEESSENNFEEELPAEKRMKISAPFKDPFGLEDFDPNLAKKEKKLKEKAIDLNEQIENQEKMLKKQRDQDKQKARLERWLSVYAGVRFLGCLILIADCSCKVQYYLTS